MAVPSLPRPLRALPGRARDAAPPLVDVLRRLRDRLIGSPVPALLVLGAYALALAQRPGAIIADSELGLAVGPQRLLANAVSVWSPTGDLGHMVGGPDYGYLFPAAPWFAGGRAIGLPVWLVQRLFLGTLLAAAALGVVALLRALGRRRRGPEHVGAAVLYVVCPYVVVLTDRTPVALLAYAALPWLLLAALRALPDTRRLRDPRALRWPAVFAFVLATAGGGVNAGPIGWLAVAVVLVVGYELACGRVSARRVGRWLLRTVPLVALLNAWWLVPLAVQARYGLHAGSLPAPEAIWSASSVTESLRGMGRWTSYLGVGFGGTLEPYTTHTAVLLFDLKVVVAGLLVPALVLVGVRWTRHARYAPLLVLLVLVGLVGMGAGFPDGTPLRSVWTSVYDRVAVARAPLREAYGAGSLVMLGLAALGGLAFAGAWGGLARRPGRVVLSAAAVVLVALAAWPLARGTAPDGQRQIDVPARWTQLALALDARGDSRRSLVLPGRATAAYRWGQTGEPVLPALTDHPVAVRSGAPRAGRRSTDTLDAVDGLVSQERLVPGQLPPLLDLLGVGDVVLAADADRGRSGGLGPLETLDALSGQGLDGGRTFGSTRTVAPASGRVASPRAVARLRDVEVRTGGLVRVVPRMAPTVFDGGARALTGLAAFGALDPARAYAAAADLGGPGIRTAAKAGGTIVVADGNRRQARVAARPRGGAGPVLEAGRTVEDGGGGGGEGGALDPYADTAAGDDAQTVQLLDGVRDISAPTSAAGTQFPEHRPAVAMDGDLRTSWLADRSLPADRAVLTVTLRAPRDVETLRLYPASDPRGVVTAVRVNGRRFAVRRGWNTLPVALKGVTRIRVAIDAVRTPRRASAGRGGIRELVIPGVQVREALRPPVVAEQALRGGDVTTATLTYLLERLTAPAPYRQGRYAGPAQAGRLRDARDPERQLARVVHPPVVRRFQATAWAHADASTSDATLDRLSGTSGPLTATSSSRLDGLPRYRASGAFDGRLSRAWVGQWIRGVPAWLQWRTDERRVLRRFRLLPPTNVRVRRPTRVRLTVDGRPGRVLGVPPDGLVTLPEPVRGRTFRLDIVDARWPAGTPAAIRARRAVGIGELRAAGLTRLDVPRRGRVALACGSAALVARGWPAGSPVGRTKLGFRGTVDRARLDAGRPLRLTGCGELELPPVDIELHGARAALVVDQLRMESVPPVGVVAPDPGTRRVVSAGTADGSNRTGASVRTSGPAWLVYGQSYDKGWEATCDGRDLGRPVPLQGYANAWPIAAPGCRDVSFRYGPEDTVRPALLLSGMGGAGLLVLLLWGLLLERGSPVAAALPESGERRRRAGTGAAVAAYREAVRRLPRMTGAPPVSSGGGAGPVAGAEAGAGSPPPSPAGPAGAADPAGRSGRGRWRPALPAPLRTACRRLATSRLLRPLRAVARTVGRALRGIRAAARPALALVGRRLAPAGRLAGRLATPSALGVRWEHAVIGGVAVGGVVALLIGPAAGTAAGALAALILWRGVPEGWLFGAAGVLLAVVVPALYVLRDHEHDAARGFDPAYATDRLGAHRAAIGALVALAIVLVRTARSPASVDAGPAAPHDDGARTGVASKVWFDAEPGPVGWFDTEPEAATWFDSDEA